MRDKRRDIESAVRCTLRNLERTNKQMECTCQHNNTVWHENFMVIKFHGLPLNCLDEKLTGLYIILRKPNFVLDVTVYIVDFHPVYGF